jgi:hypothetical protein
MAGFDIASISSSSCRASFFCIGLYAGEGILCPLPGGKGKKSWMDDSSGIGDIFPVGRDFLLALFLRFFSGSTCRGR